MHVAIVMLWSNSTTDLAQLQSLRQALTMGIVSSVRMGTVRKAAIWDVCASRYYNRAAPEPADEGGTMPLTVEEMKEVIRRGGGLYVNFVKRSTVSRILITLEQPRNKLQMGG